MQLAKGNLREEVLNVSKLVVDHKSQQTHLGGTSIVQFNGTLGKLGLFIEGVPSEVKSSITEVTNELVSSSFNVLHDEEFKEANEGKNLKGSGDRDGERGIPSVSKIRELGSGVVDVSRKVDTSGVDQVSNNTKHTDTSVLDLDVSEAVELFLITVSDHAQRIEESKRRLGTKGILEGVQGGGLDGRLLGRSESSGGGDKGGENGGLHDVSVVDSFLLMIKRDYEQSRGR